MCTVLLPPGDNPIAVNKYIISHIWFRKMLTSGAGGGTHFEPPFPLLSGVKPSFNHNIKRPNFFFLWSFEPILGGCLPFRPSQQQ